MVDLSAAPAGQRARYLQAALRQLEAARGATGLPHWLIIDEAQLPLARDARAWFEPAAAGYCVVTHRPEDLRPEVLLAVDILIALPGHLDPQRRFYFRRDADTLTGTTAANAGELEHQLRTCDDAVIVHHCQHGDFSRWVADVLGDPPLAAAIAAAENAVRTGTASTAEARATLTSTIRQRYTDT